MDKFVFKDPCCKPLVRVSGDGDRYLILKKVQPRRNSTTSSSSSAKLGALARDDRADDMVAGPGRERKENGGMRP